MKFKSFRKKKKASSASTADGSAAHSAAADSAPPESRPASTAEEPASHVPVVTPPSSPQEADGGAAGSPPASPSSPKSVASQPLRPLRLGSFDFDSPREDEPSTAPRRTRPPGFPPLFREADDMLGLCNLVYALAELRDLARNGVLNDPEGSRRVLDAPLPLGTALSIIGAEGELLREVLDDGKHEATLSALEALLDRREEARRAARRAHEAQQAEAAQRAHDRKQSDGMFGWMTNWDGCLAGGFAFDELFCGGDLGMVDPKAKRDDDSTRDDFDAGEPEVNSAVITAVGDLKSEEELVYAVVVDPAEERIAVTFRGSVTKTDFMTDARIAIKRMPDPRTFHGTQGDDAGEVGVHHGFHDYLFGEPDGRPSKYAEIMGHVEHLLAENPSYKNYKLYASGHGLGGALATLWGLYAAASPSVPPPVTVVSVASPRAGNLAFARAFAEAESQGRLRHLRIANNKDPVTLGPTFSSKQTLELSAKAFSPLGYLALTVGDDAKDEEAYYHTGMKMKLFKNVSNVSSQRCELTFSGRTIVAGAKRPPAIDEEDMEEIEQSNRRKKKESSAELPMVSYHYGTSYAERLASVETDLKGLTLNNLYREKAGGMPWVV